MIDPERAMLNLELDRLTRELDISAAAVARLVAENARLREALRIVIEKGRAVPIAEELGRTAGVSVVMGRGEWDVVVAAMQGWGEDGAK